MKRREFITLLGGCLLYTSDAADDRIYGCEPFSLEALDGYVRAAASRTRLDRGPHRRDRVSLE